MKLIADLQSTLAGETSMFRAQLLREDIARLEKLTALANDQDDRDAFKKAGLYIGWTRDDMRTHELKEPLTDLLDAIWAEVKLDNNLVKVELRAAWSRFNAVRMKVLVHCL